MMFCWLWEALIQLLLILDREARAHSEHSHMLYFLTQQKFAREWAILVEAWDLRQPAVSVSIWKCPDVSPTELPAYPP